MFTRITATTNIEQAYLEVLRQMEQDGRSGRYRGWDGLKFSDLETCSARVLGEIRDEMLNFQELAPAILVKIPKRNKPQQSREIHIYNLKDRIKAQAVYQVVEKYFDAYFSPWLFSYRSSHPSYFAARSTVRHYRKYYNRDYVLVADVTDYFKHIDTDILSEKLGCLNFPEPVLKLFSLFTNNRKIQNGKIVKPTKGLVTGHPLCPTLANLYLDDLDKYCGTRVDFYRRVGDDIIMFDQKPERLQAMYDYLREEIARLGLKINIQKTQYLKARNSFDYLGYNFINGSIRLNDSFIRRTKKRWRAQFNFHSFKSLSKKSQHLQHVLRRPLNSLEDEFFQLAEQKKLTTDAAQIRRLSESFFKILTTYFFGKYSPKNRRLLTGRLKDARFASLYKYFLYVQYGRTREKTN